MTGVPRRCRNREEASMNVVYERCSGLAVNQKSVVACVRVVAEGRVSHEVRTFSTMTSELFALADWLAACGCTHVAMESTGVFWKPVWDNGSAHGPSITTMKRPTIFEKIHESELLGKLTLPDRVLFRGHLKLRDPRTLRIFLVPL